MKGPLTVTHLGSMGIVLLSAVRALTAEAPALPDVIDKIKPAIVAVGSFQKHAGHLRFFAEPVL